MFNKEEFSRILLKIQANYNNQEDFAKYSGIGRTSISQYINCKIEIPPKPHLLEKLADASKGITNYNLSKNIHTLDKSRSPAMNSIKNYFKYIKLLKYLNLKKCMC